MPVLHFASSISLCLHRNSRLRTALPLFIAAMAIFPVSAYAQTEGITVGHAKAYDNQSLTIMLEELNNKLHQIQGIDQTSLVKALGLQQGSQQNDVARGLSVSVSPTPATAAPAPPALPDLIAPPSYQPTYGENAGDLLSDQVDLTYQIFNLRMLLERSITDRLKDSKPRRQAVIGFNITLDPPTNAKDAAAYVEITLHAGGRIELVASMPQEKTYNASALSSSSTSFGGSAVAKIVTVGYSQRNRSQTFFLYRDSDTLAIERPSSDVKAVTFGWVFRPVLGRRSVSSGMRQMFAIVSLPDTDASTDTNTDTLEVTAKTYWRHYQHGTSTTVIHPGFWDWSAKHLPEEHDPTLPPIEVFATKPVETELHPSITDVELLPTTNGNTVLQIQGDNFFTGTTITIGDKTYLTAADGLFLKSSQTMILTASSDVLSRSLNAVVNGRYGGGEALYAAPASGISILPALKPKDLKFTELQVQIHSGDPAASLTIAQISKYPHPIFMLNGAAVSYQSTIQERSEKYGWGTRQYIVATVTVPNSMLQGHDNRVGVIFPLLGTTWYSEAFIDDDTGVQLTPLSAGTTTTFLISRPKRQFNGNWQLVLDKAYPLKDPTPEPAAKPDDVVAQKPAEKKSASGQSGTTKATAKKTVTNVPNTTPASPVSFTRLLQCQDDQHKDAFGCYVLKLTVDTKFLKDYKKVALITNNGVIETIDLPATSPSPAVEKPAAPPNVTNVTPPTVGLNEVVTVTVTGIGLDAVKQISFDGKPLTFWMAPEKPATPAQPGATPAAASPNASTPPASDAASTDPTKPKASQLIVLLSRDVTQKEGQQQLLLQVDAKTYATATITVSPAPTAVKPDPTKEKSSQ